MKALERLSYNERLRELGLLSPKNRRLRGNVINVYKCLTGGVKMWEPTLFLVVSSDRSRGNVHRLKHKKFHWITENNFSV